MAGDNELKVTADDGKEYSCERVLPGRAFSLKGSPFVPSVGWQIRPTMVLVDTPYLPWKTSWES